MAVSVSPDSKARWSQRNSSSDVLSLMPDQEAQLLMGKGNGDKHTARSYSKQAPGLTRGFAAWITERALISGAFRVLLAAVVSISWMTVSSALILVNKAILKDLNFPYPMAVSSMGMLASSLLSWVVCRGLSLVEAKAQISLSFYLTRMLPVGFFMASTLYTGNKVYLYLTVSFIQMLKAFTPVITMVCLFVAGLEQPGAKVIGSVLLIAAGTILSAYGEVNMRFIGLVLMFSSELAEALRLVMTQYLLQGLKMGPFEGVMYLAPACFAWLTVGSVIVEWPTIQRLNAMQIVYDNPTIFIAAACMGFAVNVLAYATIKLASSLTLKVLGTVKNALLILVAMALYGEVVTLTQGLGYALSVGAFVVYTHLKMTQIASTTGS